MPNVRQDRARPRGATLRCIVSVDAVNSTQEIKTFGHAVVGRKIAALRDFVEFCFVYRLRGEFIGELGDGFLILWPPEPPRVLAEAFVCMNFIRAQNHQAQPPDDLNVRIAVHFGLVQPPEGHNYLDANVSLTSRLEGVTPPNSICCSSVLHDIVAPTLREYHFAEAGSDLKGFGETKYYILGPAKSASQPEDETRSQRLSFYLGTIDALERAGNWSATAATCEQGLRDFKDNPEFWYQLAFANLILRRKTESLLASHECVRLNYQVAESLHSIALHHQATEELDVAADFLMRAVQSDPNFFHAKARLAEICIKKGSLKEARQWAVQAIELAPRYFEPVAALTALDINERKTTIMERAIGRSPEHNLIPFHRSVRLRLTELHKTKQLKSVEQLLAAVFGKDWKRRSLLADRLLRVQHKQDLEEREKAEGPKMYKI